MNEQDQKDLIYKVNVLMKENKELQQSVAKLEKNKEKITQKIDELEKIIATVPPDMLPKEINVTIGQEQLRFNTVTILYIDIHGYRSISENMNVQNAIDELDHIFLNFNTIAKKYKLQIIQTVGDSFMAAGGVPVKNSTNPIDVVLAAVEMMIYVRDLQKKYAESQKPFWEIRIGINTGAVRATVYGKKKLSYDLKGETVNTAFRMATASEIGQVNISANTFVLVSEYFECDYIGKQPVKYEGELDMYYVGRLRPELSDDPSGLVPNKTFQVKYALRQFADLQELILDKLERELPEYLFYHNYKHTIDVVNQAELIGYGEKVTDEEILLLKTAGLLHDAGHIISYQNHEYYGCQIAQEILPQYNYTPDQIQRINQLIMATELPPRPHNLLERIMCDADLDYLGRIDFIPVSNTLYDELKAQNKMGSLNDWNKIQVKFLTSHYYFTETANKLREVNKEKQIERLKSIIEWTNDEEQSKYEDDLLKIAETSEKKKKEILENEQNN